MMMMMVRGNWHWIWNAQAAFDEKREQGLLCNYAAIMRNRNAVVFSTSATYLHQMMKSEIVLYSAVLCQIPNTSFQIPITSLQIPNTHSEIAYTCPSNEETWNCTFQLCAVLCCFIAHAYFAMVLIVKWANLDPTWWRWICFLGRTNRNWNV